MTCRDCKADLPEASFSWRKKHVVRHNICKSCQAVRQRRWYEANCERHKANALAIGKRVYRERRLLVDELKSVPCTDCGVSYPPFVMDFDHLEDKFDNVATMLADRRSWTAIEAEIAKCEVVCSNCHRIRTYQRRHTD